MSEYAAVHSLMSLCLHAPGIVSSLMAYSLAPSRPTCSLVTKNRGNVRSSFSKRQPSSRNAAVRPPSLMRFSSCQRRS